MTEPHFTADAGSVICTLCPRTCSLAEGRHGFCFARKNVAGRVVCATYGLCTGLAIDPIEKKPLYHFLPGSDVLSFGSIGCNLECKFCQNWTTSRCRDMAALRVHASPAEIAAAAAANRCKSVAYTYNEPIIWAEYALDTARECTRRGIKNVAVTAGYLAPEMRETFWQSMDAVNVDLKGFTEEFYEKYCRASLLPVLENLKFIARHTDTWLEVTNLLIPGANDSPDDLRAMCDWIVKHLGQDVPLHFSAFRPCYKLVDRPPTPLATLKRAYQIAVDAGLRYVYLGNVSAPGYESTQCPGCRQVVIARAGYHITYRAMNADACAFCGAKIAGRF